MASARPQQAHLFRRGNNNDEWYHITGDTSNGPYSVNELSNGVLDQTGNRIWTVGNPLRGWTLRSQGESNIIVLPNNRFLFQNEIPAAQLNTLGVTASNRGVGGTFTHILPNGHSYTIEIPMVYTSAAGSSVFRNPDRGAPWNEQWRDVINGPEGNAMREALYSEGWTRATPDEVIERALTRYLLEHRPDAVHDVLNTGERDENGNKLETESQAAAYLGRLHATELTAFIMYNYAPEIPG